MEGKQTFVRSSEKAMSYSKKKICCGFLVSFCTCASLFLYGFKNDLLVGPPRFLQASFSMTTSNPTISNDISVSLTDMAKLLKKAKLHARGVKTEDALVELITRMDNLLRKYGTSFDKSTHREVFRSENVCPEYYVNGLGYKIEQCDYATPLQDIVTIVMYYEKSNNSNLQDVLSGLKKYARNITVLVGIMGEVGKTERQEHVHVFSFPRWVTKGKVLNKLMSNVKTEYTLIARDIIEFNHDARVERLVREMERLRPEVVAGSIRNINGFWSLSCYQRAFRNYSLVFQEGYDESLHECVFCEHTDSPFLIKTLKANYLKFDETITPMGLYEDFFMRLNEEIVVCPDSMFYVDTPKRRNDVSDWEIFGRKRNLYKMKFSSGFVIYFGCNYDYPCEKIKGYVRSPCCLQELADLNNYIMKVCKDSDSVCEFHCGTLLGALKMNKVIPWEIDGDIRLLNENFTAIDNAVKRFKQGYMYRVQQTSTQCENDSIRQRRMQLLFESKHWFVEVYTYCTMDSYTLKSQNKVPTKVIHNGYAVNVPRNPSLAARDVYPQFYGHVQHFSEGGVYDIHRFSKCGVKGRHDCIDNYRPDGNIQFNDPIP